MAKFSVLNREKTIWWIMLWGQPKRANGEGGDSVTQWRRSNPSQLCPTLEISFICPLLRALYGRFRSELLYTFTYA